METLSPLSIKGKRMNCSICNTPFPENNQQDQQTCERCDTITKLILEQPEIVKKIWQEQMDEPRLLNMHSTVKDIEGEMPDVLDGKRYRAVDRESNKWYLSVSEIDGNPVEIFASTAFDKNHQLQSRISNLTTITRLISLILRHIVLSEQLTMDKCLKQIQRSSRQKNDLPDMLYNVLSKYKTNLTEKS